MLDTIRRITKEKWKWYIKDCEYRSTLAKILNQDRDDMYDW